jgi:hypothetical protein
VILTIGSNVRQLLALSQLNLAGSVLATQKALLALRAERLRVNRSLLLFIPLLWTPLIIVLARSWFGVDLYHLLPTWLAANLAFGLAFIPLGLWLARRFESQLGGRELSEAIQTLDALNRFSEE